MARTESFMAGLVLVAAVAALAHGQTPDSERARICSPGFSATLRPSEAATNAIKRALMAAQGIPLSQIRLYKLDHICPLELDCPPLALSNLQLQRNDIAAAKDVREDAARRDYCDGKISLDEARGQFKRD